MKLNVNAMKESGLKALVPFAFLLMNGAVFAQSNEGDKLAFGSTTVASASREGYNASIVNADESGNNNSVLSDVADNGHNSFRQTDLFVPVPEPGSTGTKGFSTPYLTPNPFSSVINVNFSTATAGEMEVSIYDYTGTMLYGGPVSYKQGANSLILNLYNLNEGMYILRMQVGNTVSTQKVIKKKKTLM